MDYGLEKRTVNFGRNVVKLCKGVPNSKLNDPITSQLLRSATSVGANYFEANGASSKRDFRNKIHICKKEAKETTYWLSILEDIATDKDILRELQ